MINKIVGENIRRFREARGLNQSQLATLVSLASTYISDIEEGRRGITVRKMAQIASALNVHPSSLISNAHVQPVEYYIQHVFKVRQVPEHSVIPLGREALKTVF